MIESTFTSLPPEIHLMIAKTMPVEDLYHISSTNRSMFVLYSKGLTSWPAEYLRDLTSAHLAEHKKENTDSLEIHRMSFPKNRNYLTRIDGFLNRYLACITPGQFRSLLQDVGTTNYYFQSAAIRCLLTEQHIPGYFWKWKAPKPSGLGAVQSLEDRLGFLKVLFEQITAAGTRTEFDHWSPQTLCGRNMWKDTFLSMAIVSNSLKAVQLVWEVYHERSRETLEDTIDNLLLCTISNYRATPSGVLEIMDYLMNEWQIPADFTLNDTCVRIPPPPWNQPPSMISILFRLRNVRIFHCCCYISACPYENPQIPTEIIKLLLRRGARVDGDHCNPLPLALWYIYSGIASWEDLYQPLGPEGALLALLEAGADPNIIPRQTGITLLHFVESLWDDRKAFDFLVQKSAAGGYINHQSQIEFRFPIRLGTGLLNYGKHRLSPLQTLLLTIVDLDLSQAKTDRLIPFVAMLLEYGADPELRDDENVGISWSAREIAERDLPRMEGIFRAFNIAIKL